MDSVEQFLTDVAQAIEAAEEQVGAAAVKIARENIEKQNLVHSGTLRDSIEARTTKGGKVLVGTDTDYGNIYNYGGTVKQRNRSWTVAKRTFIDAPLGQKAVQSAEDGLVNALESALESALRRI
jgi:phage gpG-like protein